MLPDEHVLSRHLDLAYPPSGYSQEDTMHFRFSPSPISSISPRLSECRGRRGSNGQISSNSRKEITSLLRVQRTGERWGAMWNSCVFPLRVGSVAVLRRAEGSWLQQVAVSPMCRMSEASARTERRRARYLASGVGHARPGSRLINILTAIADPDMESDGRKPRDEACGTSLLSYLSALRAQAHSQISIEVASSATSAAPAA
jgi:hypothetical protein